MAETGPALDLPAADDGIDPETRGARARAALSAVVLGYDVPPEDQDAALSEYLAVRDAGARRRASPCWPTSSSLLEIFADLAELTRNRPVDEDRQTELRVHSSREHFHTFLQSLDVERGGLPEQFRERLVRVLRHYGVEDLDRTPELEAAVFRIFLAQQRTTPEVALVSALLGSLEPRDPADRAARRPGPRACWSASVASRSRATRRSATWPAASGSAGSTSRPWTRSARTSCSACATSSRRSRPTATTRRPGPTHRGAGGHPRADRALPVPSGSSRASRLASRCWRCSPGATTASTTCTTCSRSTQPTCATGRGRELHPRRATDPAGVSVGTVAELARPARRARHLGDRRHVAAARRDEEAVVDLYLHWPDAPDVGRRDERPSCGPCWPRCPLAHDVRRVVRGRLLRRRPPGRLLRVPPRRTTASRGRGRPDPRRAPDGRASPRPVAAAQLPRHPRRGARGRAALRVRRPGEPVRPAPGGPRPGAPDVRRTRRGRHHHRPAARRARGGELPGVDPARAGGPRDRRRQAGHEPRLGPRLAGRRPRPRRA